MQDGKTYKHTTMMTWVKYNNPVKSIKIGSSSFAVKGFNKDTQAFMKKVSGSSKLTVKLKSGYKLNYLGFSRGGVYKSIKNGSKIRFTKKGSNNTVVFVNYTDPKGYDGDLSLFVA